MIRRPPRSTLFPYTRSSDLVNAAQAAAGPIRPVARLAGAVPPRSEEHTSELQSHSHLVCRLLLAKSPAAAAGGVEPTRIGQFGPWGAYTVSLTVFFDCFAPAKPSSSNPNPPTPP